MSDPKTVSGKIVSVQAKGHFTAKSGRDEGKTKYSFEIVLDTGEHGELAVLESELNGREAPINIGDTHEFSVYEGSNGYADKWYLKKPKAESGWKGGGKQWTPDPERENRRERWTKQLMITRQACLNTACQLTANGGAKADLKTLKDTAEALEQWVMRGMDLSKIVNPVQNGTPAQAAPAKAPARADQVPDPEPMPF